MNNVSTVLLRGTSSVQRIKLGQVATAGSFKVVISGIGTTAAIAAPVTASGIAGAIQALGGLAASATVVNNNIAPGRQFTVTIPGGAVSAFTFSNNTLTDAGAVAVVLTVIPVTTYVDAATAVTAIGADPVQTGDRRIVVASSAGQRITNGANLKLSANWTSSAAGDWIELAQLDDANWYELNRRSAVSGPNAYRIITERNNPMSSALNPAPRGMSMGTAVPVNPASSTGTRAAFPIVSADRTPPAGYKAVMSIRAVVVTNSTAPAVTLTFSLNPLTAPTGTGGATSMTTGSAVAGSTTTIATPAANSIVQANTADFDAPGDGLYGLIVSNDVSIAVNGDIVVDVTLMWRWVPV